METMSEYSVFPEIKPNHTNEYAFKLCPCTHAITQPAAPAPIQLDNSAKSLKGMLKLSRSQMGLTELQWEEIPELFFPFKRRTEWIGYGVNYWVNRLPKCKKDE